MGSFGLSKEARRMVAVLIVGAVLVVLNQTLLSPALPSIMEHMGVSQTTVQWLTSAYSLTEAVVIPLAAWAMGRFSTRKLFIGCMALFAAGSLVAAVAPVFAVLLFGRVMQAMSTGILMVMVMSLILLSFPRERRGQAMGLVSLVIAFAPALGPTVGGLLVDLVGWRALFCVVVAAAVLVILLAWRTLVNREGFERASIDAPSIALSSLGLVSLLYGLSSFSSADNTALCIVLIAAGLALLGLFARRQFRLEQPMLRIEVLKSRRYRSGILTLFFLQAMLIGLGVLLPLYVQNVLGLTATESGLVTLPGAVLGAAMSFAAGRIFDSRGVRGVALAGGAVLLAGSASMAFFGMGTPVWFVVAGYLVTCVGMQMLMTPVNTWGVNSLGNDLVEHATAVINTMNQVGGSLGTALIVSFSSLGAQAAVAGGQIEQLASGYRLAFGVVLALAAVVCVLVAVCVKNKESDPAPASRAGVVDGSGAVHTLREAMDAHPVTVPSGASMAEAARVLASSDSSGAVVVGEDGAVRGFLSNSDVLRFFGDQMRTAFGGGFAVTSRLDDEGALQRARRLFDIKVDEMATRQVISVGPETSFEDACRILAEKRLKQLPVLEDGRLVGVVHRSALLRAVSRFLEEADAR